VNAGATVVIVQFIVTQRWETPREDWLFSNALWRHVMPRRSQVVELCQPISTNTFY